MSTPLLEVLHLAVTYRSGDHVVRAVRGVDFTLQAGQTLGMAGESGCGKTTVALSLLRLLPRTAELSGQILFKGEDVISLGLQKLRAVRWAGASVVFQGAMSSLNPVHTIGDQILEPILLHEKVTRHEAHQRAADLLDSVGVSARRQANYPHELSGGQRQRVMIAMALACRPDLIIADEPTTALDVIVQAQVLKLLTELVYDRQIGMIMISHDLPVLADACERLAIMYAGRIVELGPSGALLAAPTHPYTRILSRAFPQTGDPSSRFAPAGLPGEPPNFRSDLQGCSFAPRCPEVMDKCRTSEIQLWPSGPIRTSACVKVLDLATAPVGGAALEHVSEPDSSPSRPYDYAPAAEPVLEVRDLSVVYPARRNRGTARAADGVNLSIGRGEIVALVGESGCGKSTLARALVGLIQPTTGEVCYEGKQLRYSGVALREYRRHVQLVLQDAAGALNPRQNVFDSVAEGPRLHGMRVGLEQRVHSALSRSGLRPPENFITRYPHELSGGEQQRVVIAGALSLNPSVIIADEPVSSLDASVRGEILKLILDLRDHLSLSVLIVSNDLGVGWNIADRMAVMYLGRIVEVGTVDDVLSQPQHPYTQALISVLPDGQRTGARSILAGEPPDPTRIPSACRFHPRCPRLAALSPGDPRGELCRGHDVPVLAAGSEGQRLIACHLVDMA